MVVGAKVCDLTEDVLWFVCGLYVGILTSPLTANIHIFAQYIFSHILCRDQNARKYVVSEKNN